jgi:hypothetical protein
LLLHGYFNWHPKHMNEAIVQKLGGRDDYYPHILEAMFPRVFEKIFQLWGTPALEGYLDELLMDSRDGKRQGFPQAAATEILRLSLFCVMPVQRSGKDVWGEVSEKKRYDIEQLGFKHTSQGFMQASESGSIQAIKLFLSSGIDLEARDERGWTALMSAAFNGKAEAVGLLLKSGAKINVQDTNGYSPLHWAAFNGHDNVVRLLLQNGAEPNALSNFGWTPLMQAATRGHMLVSAQLIAAGASVNIVSADKWTALHKAVSNGQAGLVRLLLSKGANPAIEYQQGCNALTLAIKGGNVEIITMLTPK